MGAHCLLQHLGRAPGTAVSWGWGVLECCPGALLAVPGWPELRQRVLWHLRSLGNLSAVCPRGWRKPCPQEHPPGCCRDHKGCRAFLSPPGLITAKECQQ